MINNLQKQLRSPIVWFGGKGAMVEKLLALMPPHEYYIEVFGGGASLLFGKKPASVETYNDLDEGLINFFRVLRDPIKFKKFHELVKFTLNSRAEYNYCSSTWKETKDEIDRAYRWFVTARLSFSGRINSGWSYGVSPVSSSGRWNSCIELLPEIHERFKTVQIECSDWRKILDVYSAPGYLAYLDPPYVHSTRKDGNYNHELTDQDHKDLINTILEYPAMIMLSGYDNDIYLPLIDAGWDIQKFNLSCSVAKTKGLGSRLEKQPRVEVVWRNPAVMAAIESGSRQLKLL